MTDVVDAAHRWLAADPDERTRAELERTLRRAAEGDEGARAELADAFSGPLEFGTAGLRGRMGPGPRRMNSVVVAQAAAGLGRYLLEHGGGAVVVGYDARHDSDLFARVTAEVLTGMGLSVMVLPEPLPTPVLAFAIRRLGCAAGVMVTASHNPPHDNGYKVYLGDGMQIAPPVDAQISAHIAAVAAEGPIADLPRGTEWTTLTEDIVEAYLQRATGLIEDGVPLHPRIAYTAMHGVGGRVFLRALEDAGFPEPVVVEQQFAPDPDFPTTAFPNPEEPGAMDLGLALAAEQDCDLLIAHDPDADRCAIGIPTPEGWRMLSGDEVGWLLAWWIATGDRRLSRARVFVESIASGTMLEGIARSAGIEYAQTLTGFKWIARVPSIMYGYEEALGYCVDPDGVRDKDGITAGLLMAELVGRLKGWNATIAQVLDDLAVEHGVHLTRPVTARVQDLARITRVMDSLRSAPPDEIGGQAVASVVDFSNRGDDMPSADVLLFRLISGGRVVVRPSGTEPKIKCYLQSVVPVTSTIADARAAAAAELDAIAVDVRRWLE